MTVILRFFTMGKRLQKKKKGKKRNPRIHLVLKLVVTYSHYEHAPLHPPSSLTLSSPFCVGFLCFLSIAGFRNPKLNPLIPIEIQSSQYTRLGYLFGWCLLLPAPAVFVEGCLIWTNRTCWFKTKYKVGDPFHPKFSKQSISDGPQVARMIASVGAFARSQILWD
ncbi:hypothetical protein RJT34_02857 [Clitoria ternatea]|uniref:Uncharacterized protein n=1 Tax=Clitoria ternatea TaxID=43366 RepID=A0AAN9KL09_CLITE